LYGEHGGDVQEQELGRTPSLEPFLPRGDTLSLASGDTLALGLAYSDSLEFQPGQAHLHHEDSNLATVWQAVRGTGTQTGTDTQ